jgi:2-methylcitrate dehydratase PrpD
VALGNELMCRLRVIYSPTGRGPASDWFLTQLFGYFGAAAAASLVLGADEDALVSAFGLAYMQAAGGKEPGFGVGSTGRAIYPAFAAMGGVQAALLAHAGVVGPAAVFDGAANLFRLYLGGDLAASQAEALVAPSPWQFEATCIKPWPSCRLSHPYIAAALALRAQLGIGAGESRASPGGQGAPAIEDRVAGRITVAVNASAARLCTPIEGRRRPVTLQDAKYSVPYMTAHALVNGRVELAGLDERALADARVHAMADRIDVAETLPDGPGHPPAEIHARASDGTSCIARAGRFDLETDGVRAKFMACLAMAGRDAAQAASLWSRLAGATEEGAAAAGTAAGTAWLFA